MGGNVRHYRHLQQQQPATHNMRRFQHSGRQSTPTLGARGPGRALQAQSVRVESAAYYMTQLKIISFSRDSLHLCLSFYFSFSLFLSRILLSF